MENTDARVSFEQNVFSYKKRLHHRVFLWNLRIFQKCFYTEHLWKVASGKYITKNCLKA